MKKKTEESIRFWGVFLPLLLLITIPINPFWLFIIKQIAVLFIVILLPRKFYHSSKRKVMKWQEEQYVTAISVKWSIVEIVIVVIVMTIQSKGSIR